MSELIDNIKGNDMATAIRSMTKTEGWILLSQAIERNEISVLRKRLLQGEYETMAERKSEVESLKTWELIMNAPERYIGQLVTDPQADDGDGDPYAKTRAEIDGMSKAKDDDRGE